MTVKEFNEWLSKYNGAFCFVHAMDKAMDNAGNKARHQMVCIGWSDEMKSTLLEALETLKEKKRSMVDKDASLTSNDELLKKLINNRIHLAEINKTNYVYFTPSERLRIKEWLDSQPKDGDGDAG